jgi:hypothetical protein
MYYGWHNTKILHEERVKQLSRDYTTHNNVWIWKVQHMFIRLWSTMINRVHKAKRQAFTLSRPAHHTTKCIQCTQIDIT